MLRELCAVARARPAHPPANAKVNRPQQVVEDAAVLRDLRLLHLALLRRAHRLQAGEPEVEVAVQRYREYRSSSRPMTVSPRTI